MHSRVEIPQHGMQQHQQFLNKFSQQQEFKQYSTTYPVLGIPNIPQSQAQLQLPVLQQNAMLNVTSYSTNEQYNRHQYTSQYPLLQQHSMQQQYISHATYQSLMPTEQTNGTQIQFEQSQRNNEVSQRADNIFEAISPNCCNDFQIESTMIQTDQQQQQLSLYQQSQYQLNTNIAEKECIKLEEEELKSFTVAPQCSFMDAYREIDEICKKADIIQRDRIKIEEQIIIAAKPFQLPNVSLVKAQSNTIQFDQQQKYSQTLSENTSMSTFRMSSSTQQLQQYKMPQMSNYSNSIQDNQSRQERKMLMNYVETSLSKINESCLQCNLYRDIALMFAKFKPKLFGEYQKPLNIEQELKSKVKTNAHRPHSITEVDQEIDAILRRLQILDGHQKRKKEEAFKTVKFLLLSNVKSKKRHRTLRQVLTARQSQQKLQQKLENWQTPSENVLLQNNNYLYSHQTTQSHQDRQTPIKHKKDQTQSIVQDYNFNQQNNFSSATIPGQNLKLFRECEDIEMILNELEEIDRSEQQKHEIKSNIVFELTRVQTQVEKLLTDVRAIRDLSSGKVQQIQLNQLLDDMELINLELRKWRITNTKTKNWRLLQMMKLCQNNLQTISELAKLKKKEVNVKIPQLADANRLRQIQTIQLQFK
ncbi:hypothetical protein DOY81_003976 [Sarcophaga bullata]|nr:hypothetical protein DOY81_003976 [Sarcophaga bullata]